MSIGAIKIWKIGQDAQLPTRETPLAIGYDVSAYRIQDRMTKKPIGDLPYTLQPGEEVLLGIGVVIELPWKYEISVRPRSGLANKFRVQLFNTPGTVDPDFRGEVGCLLHNYSDEPFIIEKGMRIAQLIFSTVEIPEFVEVKNYDELSGTIRGEGGFGSTGYMGHGPGIEQYNRQIAALDRYFMNIVLAVAKRSNCVRGCKRGRNGEFPRDRQGYLKGQTRCFGSIIVDGDQVIASGYNEQAKGEPLCEELGCLRDELTIPSGQQIEICRAIHAEQMAINAAAKRGIAIRGLSMYTNAEPCLICARIIAGLELDSLVVVGGGYGETHGLQIVRNSGTIVRIISKS